jgi:hypothetical protein
LSFQRPGRCGGIKKAPITPEASESWNDWVPIRL